MIYIVEDDDNILWNMTIANATDAPQRQGIIFPYLSGIEYSDRNDSHYFVPKYQNIDSNETVYIYEESAPSFPMQFMDIYSPKEQGGLALTTRERELTVRKYSLEKEEKLLFFVEYPDIYCEIAPSETFISSPTCLTAHKGDWRAAFGLYKKWLDSWYEPYHCQDKQWYRECFWLLAEITDFFETYEMVRFPIWHEKGENPKFNFLDILEEQKSVSGTYPDILHSNALGITENVWSKEKAAFLEKGVKEHTRSNEYASYIMQSIVENKPYEIGGNVLNTGHLITNLPENACVEVPCLVNGYGVHPCHVGALPVQCAAMNMTNINVQLLTIEAAVTGKKEHIYQAAMLDPHTGSELDIDTIKKMVDDLLEAHKDFLPEYI